jgi:hypothetical protein
MSTVEAIAIGVGAVLIVVVLWKALTGGMPSRSGAEASDAGSAGGGDGD